MGGLGACVQSANILSPYCIKGHETEPISLIYAKNYLLYCVPENLYHTKPANDA